jgi:hypothetical protein
MGGSATTGAGGSMSGTTTTPGVTTGTAPGASTLPGAPGSAIGPNGGDQRSEPLDDPRADRHDHHARQRRRQQRLYCRHDRMQRHYRQRQLDGPGGNEFHGSRNVRWHFRNFERDHYSLGSPVHRALSCLQERAFG